MGRIKLCFLMVMLLLAACSPNHPSSPQSNDTLTIYDLVAISLSSGDGNYGEQTTSVIKTITVTNSGDSVSGDISPTISGVNSSDFAIIYQNGCTSVLPTKKCTVKVTFDGRNKPPGNYVASLDFSTLLSVPLTATVPAPPPPVSSGNENYSVLISSQESKDGIDFGTLTGTQSVLKTIYIKNIGTASTPLSSVALSSTDYTLSYNQCANKVLAPGQQCMIKVSFSASGKSPNTYSANLTFDTLVTPLTALIPGASGGGGGSSTPQISLLEGTSLALDPIDFGSMLEGQSLQKILYIKNTGTVDIASVTAELAGTNAADYSLVYNQCVNKALKVNDACQLRILFSASGKLSGTYAAQLSVSSLSFSHNLTAQVLANYQLSVAKKIDGIRSTTLGDLSDGDKILCLSGCSLKSAIYSNGSVVNLQYTVPPGYEIVSWGGDCATSGNSSVCQLTMNSNKNVEINIQAVVPPSNLTLVINNGDDYTNQSNVNLAISAIGANEIKISNTSDCSAGTWIPFVSSTVFGLTNLNQNSTVSVIARNAGGQSACVTDSIIHDNIIPQVVFDQAVDQVITGGSYTFGFTLTDTNLSSDITIDEYSQGACTGSFVTHNLAGSSLGVSLNEGQTKSIKVTTTDLAGNMLESCSYAVTSGAVTYSPTYSAYGDCLNNLSEPIVACDGQGTQTRTLNECTQVINGVPGDIVNNSYCADYDIPENTIIQCPSPQGEKVVLIDNGSQTFTCDAGSVDLQLVSTTCDTNYHEESGACVENPVCPQDYVFNGIECISINSCAAGNHLNFSTFTCDLDKVACDTGIDNSIGAMDWDSNSSSYGSCTWLGCDFNYAQASSINQCIESVSKKPFYAPYGLTYDSNGNLYVVDGSGSSGSSIVYKVNGETGIADRYAGRGTARSGTDGTIASSSFLNQPRAVAADSNNNLYIIDYNNHYIRKVDAQTNIITKFAGGSTSGFAGDGGQASVAQVNNPLGIAADTANNIYIADTSNNRIRVVDTNGVINTVAGNGNAPYSGDNVQATSSALSAPEGVVVDELGNIYISDTGNNRIRKVATSGIITTIAGTGVAGFSGEGGLATSAQINAPGQIDLDAAGNIYFVDKSNFRVRKIDTSGIITTIAGNGQSGDTGDGGQAISAKIIPYGLTVSPQGNVIISDTTSGLIRKVKNGVINVLAGKRKYAAPGLVFNYDNSSFSLQGITKDETTGDLLVVDGQAVGVLRIDPVTKTITQIAGNGTSGLSGDGGAATSAQMYNPKDIVRDPSGNLYIADWNNMRVRKVTPGGIISTLTGVGNSGSAGTGTAVTVGGVNATGAKLCFGPESLAFDNSGNLYIGTQYQIYKLNLTTNIINTVVGSNCSSSFSGDGGQATAAKISGALAMAFDSSNNLYFIDWGNKRIRKVTASTGVITTIAGTGVAGIAGDGGPATSAQIFNSTPSRSGMYFDSQNNLFFSDINSLRKISNAGIITTEVGQLCTTTCNSARQGDGLVAAGSTGIGIRAFDIMVDSQGNRYITDDGKSVRKIDAQTSVFSTVIGENVGGNILSFPVLWPGQDLK